MPYTFHFEMMNSILLLETFKAWDIFYNTALLSTSLQQITETFTEQQNSSFNTEMKLHTGGFYLLMWPLKKHTQTHTLAYAQLYIGHRTIKYI